MFPPAKARAILLAALAGLPVATGPASVQVPPAEAWRTFETAYFRITFPKPQLAKRSHRRRPAGKVVGAGGLRLL